MNADVMAEWMRRQGLHVEQTASSYWVGLGPRIFQAFPYHLTFQLTTEELRATLCKLRARGVRYSAPLDAEEGKISYHVMYAGNTYTLEQLSSKARYDVRKGLGCFRVEPLTFSELATEGWDVRLNTLQRQGRQTAENSNWWKQLCLSAEGLSGFECWGARDIQTGRLASSLLACICDDCFCILYQQSLSESLSLGVNNALSFVVTEMAIRRPGISRVFYGLHSLDAPDSVDAYKFRMKFMALPVRQRVAFHSTIEPFINGATQGVLRGLRRLGLGGPTLAKAEGLMRFYREGKLPLASQTWPAALNDQRASLLGHN
jgi:hypothetical protein